MRADFISKCILLVLLSVLTAFCAHVASAQKLATLPDPGEPIVGTFTSEDTDGRQLVLTAGPRLTVAMKPLRQTTAQYWTIAPVARDMVRIQIFAEEKFWSLTIDARTGEVGFARSDQVAEQFWRITQSLATPNAVRLESVASRGQFLAGYSDSSVVLEAAGASSSQNWFFDVAPPPQSVNVPPQKMLQVDQQLNQPIASVRAKLVNSHSKDLLVRVTDLRNGKFKDISIPPRGAREITLDRDTGATFTESYQVIGPLGNVLTRQFTTTLPPRTIYDISVYEKFLQSIAIDRTGKSPNKIEDINYQPKSVGIFPIPPGTQFDGGEIDVYRVAKQANNPGAVRRIDPNEFNQSEDSDPLEDALRGLRGR